MFCEHIEFWPLHFKRPAILPFHYSLESGHFTPFRDILNGEKPLLRFVKLLYAFLRFDEITF